MLSVLVIEDEASYEKALEVALGREGFQVHSVPDGPQGLVGFREDPPDVVLLDLMLPGMSGLDVLRKIREAATTPVIVVSAKDSEAGVVSALELGADDHLTKPYSVRELVARIHAATRRANDIEGARGDRDRRGSARYRSSPASGRRRGHRSASQGIHVVARADGASRKGGDAGEATRAGLGPGLGSRYKTLDQHIRRLRRKLEAAPDAPTIETVRGVGYRLEP